MRITNYKLLIIKYTNEWKDAKNIKKNLDKRLEIWYNNGVMERRIHNIIIEPFLTKR